MKHASFTVRSNTRTELIDITARIRESVTTAGITEGICMIYVPHTTAGITINESADPDVAADIIDALDRMVPWQCGYRHCEGNAAAHIKASLLGSSVHVGVIDGHLELGAWQGVFFCEFDGPRNRRVNVYTMSSKG